MNYTTKQILCQLMPNPYFKFKQFAVYHDKCAMKVGTDGVLLGAWATISRKKNILDVGTGSGLISLMLAQRTKAFPLIDAIDIEADAVVQAVINVDNSPFGNIRCIETSLQDFTLMPCRKYDLIVSNPPFFSSSLKSPEKKRTLARHTDTLPIEELFLHSKSLLNQEEGILSIIYPYTEKKYLLELAGKTGLSVSRITNVIPTADSTPKRVLMEFSIKPVSNIIENNLTIEKGRHIYTDEFIDLVKDFYLRI